MPYYEEIKTLFLHIPKTGGSSLENYFKVQYTEKLYSNTGGNIILPDQLKLISLQHLTYNNIYKYKHLLNITFDENLKIITIVRNPYNRIISDLFWWKFIDKSSNKTTVFNVIKEYIFKENLDNHNIPQYKFVIDENNNLIKNIKIFKTETLTEELKNYGLLYYEGNSETKNYFDYLNEDSIKLINIFYKKDFELFNYDYITL
jgi:hypothetical protein